VFGDLLPAVLAWGISSAPGALSRRPRSLLGAPPRPPWPDLPTIIPGSTSRPPGLQLAFAEFGYVLIGLAAATFIAARSSDETAGRLELLLATPLTRVRWAAASTVSVWLAVAFVTVLLAAAVALGVASVGQDAIRPATGTLVLALYGAALTGIGVAVAGVFRASFATPVVLAVAIGTFLVDLLAPALHLPDWVEGLALTTHLGEPMIGAWDPVGVVACVAIAIGGLVIGAWGMRRRDVGA
jgi:ABC-2 type transport system permease protein